MLNRVKQCSLIIINDAILKNIVTDNCSSFIITNLKGIRFNVSKITVIQSDIKKITEELTNSNREHDITLIVSDLSHGIIGKAIEKVFGKKLIRREQLRQILVQNEVPFEEEELYYPLCMNLLEGAIYPLIHIQRLFVINEKYMDGIILVLKEYLTKYDEPSVFEKVADIYHNENIEVLGTLNYNVVKYKVGSIDNNNVLLEYSCEDLDSLLQFENDVGSRVFINASKPVLSDKVYFDSNILLQQTINAIETCFETYGLENTFFSFNGGKDCTVLLHLALVVLEKQYPSYSHKPICLYVQGDEPFKEQEEFIDKCKQFYNLKVITYKMEIKEALRRTLAEHSNLKACLMGTRRTDPFSQDLSEFQFTDGDYPEVMRVSPLLNWSYYHIWDYLLFYKVPYCKLYDMGYTSLGNVNNTLQNPDLFYKDPFDGNEKYLPAYKLLREEAERVGRSG